MRELEFAASLHFAYGNEYPTEELETIWKEVLLYQFHDILPGSSIKRVFDESLARYEILLARVTELTDQMYRGFASSIGTHGAVRPMVFFNSLPWERCEWMQLDNQWIQVTIPAMGYQVIDSAALSPYSSFEVTAVNDTLENELIKIGFGADGSILSIIDKALGREVIAAGESANVLSIYHDDGDAWDFPGDYAGTKPAHLKLMQSKTYISGPKAVVEQEYHYGKSVLTQKIILTAGSKRIDFETDVDWQEDSKMLRASFPVNVYTDQVNCDIQFGHLKRQTHRNTLWDYAKDEISAHQWIDLSQSDFGVALLNDCKYGYSVNRNVMDINLLRSPSHPDPTCDRARHQFVYAILPHEGDFIQAEVFKQGYELNAPITVVLASEEEGGLPKRFSGFEIEGPKVMIEAVKKAEDEDALVVRLYETSGMNGEIKLSVHLPHREALLADLMENPLETLSGDEGHYLLSFTPFEIKTVLIRLLH
ncbi:alpha-mannosidase [Paenibacillus sp. V4I5]|nr:alpha-mannosidase [Paenibacillus sp. V4I5]